MRDVYMKKTIFLWFLLCIGCILTARGNDRVQGGTGVQVDHIDMNIEATASDSRTWYIYTDEADVMAGTIRGRNAGGVFSSASVLGQDAIWFHGSYDEACLEAAEKEKLVLVFGWSKY